MGPLGIEVKTSSLFVSKELNNLISARESVGLEEFGETWIFLPTGTFPVQAPWHFCIENIGKAENLYPKHGFKQLEMCHTNNFAVTEEKRRNGVEDRGVCWLRHLFLL